MPERDAERAAARAAFRAYVRTHHPDVGGDPAKFAAELPRLREAARLQTTENRYDAPILVVPREWGVRALLRRIRTWRSRRRRKPRVR